MTEPSPLLTAMLAVAGEVGTLPKDKLNPAFRSKFTPLDTIVETVNPILCTHGLVWTALPGRGDDGKPVLKYRLGHAPSGETLDGEMELLLVKNDPQGQGSAITYARRYALCAVLNLVADEDDDGNGGSTPPRSAAKPAASKPTAKKTAAKATEGTIQESEVSALARLYAASGWKETDAEDPHATLRMQLAAVGAGNQGEIVACIRALTVAQGGTVRSALEEARDSK